MSRLTRLILTGLLLPLAARASFSPGELIVRLREAPVRNRMDQVLVTRIARIDTLVATDEATVSVPLAAFERRFPEVAPIVLVRTATTVDLDMLEGAIAADPNVEWVTRNHHYRPNGSDQRGLDDPVVPNDELYGDEWWLTRISAPLAWELSRGDSSVIIGIIDTGVDYLHPDLQPNIWTNWADADSDGVDDDDNGFVDDVIGWDFVDAPTLPSAGDHLERDNDPMDELGHGTYVAGLAAAATDNRTCYASIGFHCRIMCLRAGNREGFLEEDDVAAAILYGAQMHASVINMSFGDVVASPLLREVVRIAHQAGVTLLASAGNNYSRNVHYPSGFPEVISVGATDERDRRASFSNYGPSVDVMAPGYNMLSTFPSFDSLLHHECGEWDYPHGTSYAVALASGVAGLMLAVNPQLQPDDILQILRSTADDIDRDGWDSSTVNGRLNARRAVELASFGSNVVARIISPSADHGLQQDVAVIGDAWGPSFDHYELLYGLGENPREWISISRGDQRRFDDSLGWIALPVVDTVLIARLEVYGTEGSVSIDHRHLYVQRSAPAIDSLRVRRMLDYDTYGDLVQVWANQHTTASFLLTRPGAADSLREEFGYVAEDHAGFLSQIQHPGAWDVRIRLENVAGLSSSSDPFPFVVNDPPFRSSLFQRTTTNLPHGHLGSFTSDYDCDGAAEVWLLPIGDNGALDDPLEPWEWDGQQFVSTGNTYGIHIPVGVGDADGDGRLEMMAYRSNETRIWEQSDPCSLLNTLVLEDTTMAGAGFIDLDSANPAHEIIARVNRGRDIYGEQRFVIYQVGSGFALSVVDTLPNETRGYNNLGPPRLIVRDLDADGSLDFVFGDYDGDLILCEYQNARIVPKSSFRLPLNDASVWMDAGDVDGDGALELVAGCRSNSVGGSESQRRSRHWEYFVFELASGDSLVPVDSIFILGNEDVADHPASIRVADVDGNGAADILISAYPDYYIVAFDSVSRRYRPVWYHTPSSSATSLVVDWDGNGLNEIFFTDGSQFVRVEASAAFGQRPLPPLGLAGEPLGPDSIRLTWQPSATAVRYIAYRRLDSPPFSAIATTTDTSLLVDELPEDVGYTYAVAGVNPSFPDTISAYSNAVTLAANRPPAASDTARFIEPRSVEVRFSEAMGPSAYYQWSYRLTDGRMPAVVALGEGGRVAYLSFDGSFDVGWHPLQLAGLRDAQGTRLPVSESSLIFEVFPVGIELPHVLSHRVVGGVRAVKAEITFSEGMSESVLGAANYLMDAPRRVIAVRGLVDDRRSVAIEFDARYPVGALGQPTRVRLRQMYSEGGLPLDTTSGRADLVLGGPATTIDDAFVYPNPYKGVTAGNERGVYFAGLPEHATIRVFSVPGVLVRKIEHDNPSGASLWDLMNEDGEPVASGVYLYTIQNDGQTVRGKLAVMR